MFNQIKKEQKTTKIDNLSIYQMSYTHTHTHTYIYIYIYIYFKKNNETGHIGL